MKVEVKDLCKQFGKNKVLNHVNLQVNEGKIYGIAGRNGSGKTMLFRCMAGLVRPSSGKLSLMEKNYMRIFSCLPIWEL